MKNAKKIISVCLLTVLLLSNIVFAEPDVNDSSNKELYNVNYDKGSDQFREIHKKAIDLGVCSLNSDGTITINADATALNLSTESFNQYITGIEEINDVVRLGVGSFDKNFSLNLKPKEEISKIIFERDKKRRENGDFNSTNRFDTNSNTLGLNFSTVLPNNESALNSVTLPYLFAWTIADANKQELTDYFLAVSRLDPRGAFAAATGYFQGKVQRGGAWDYKVLPGFAPYNKEWIAVQRYTVSVKTSEWFGNYNYGYAGSVLYSLGTLLDVAYIIGGDSDSPEDTAAITQGYNEAQ